MSNHEARAAQQIVQRLDRLEVETIPLLRGEVEGMQRTFRTVMDSHERQIAALSQKSPHPIVTDAMIEAGADAVERYFGNKVRAKAIARDVIAAALLAEEGEW